jgi:two-component system, NarL family, invasion response regulator UvrY
MTAEVTVLVVDDSPAYLGALRDVVAATPGFVLVGEATTGEYAVGVAASLAPDLVLMDVRLPRLGGAEAGARIRRQRPGTVVVLLSSAEEEAIPHRARVAASAVLDKRRLSPDALSELWSEITRRRLVPAPPRETGTP